MSTLRTNAILDASGGTTATVNGYAPSLSNMAGRNRIINGAMTIDQRNAGASVTPASSGTYILDRWRADLSVASKYSVQQNAGAVTPPTGFSNYLGATSTSAYSVGANEQFTLRHFIEGFNSADLAWGTASAQSITLSFWVRSSLTGTFGGTLVNSAQDRYYGFAYTISSANTWEFKTITVAGDTSGTWLTNNGIGIAVRFSLGSGSSSVAAAGSWGSSSFTGVTGQVNIVATSGATFYITGVQLEAGSIATPFERRPYGTELALCQRYCLVDTNDNAAYRHFATGYASSTTSGTFVRQLPVVMRATPSITVSDATRFTFDGNATVSTTAVTDGGYGSPSVVRIAGTVASGLTTGYSYHLGSNGSSTRCSITYSAEL